MNKEKPSRDFYTQFSNNAFNVNQSEMRFSAS